MLVLILGVRAKSSESRQDLDRAQDQAQRQGGLGVGVHGKSPHDISVRSSAVSMVTYHGQVIRT